MPPRARNPHGRRPTRTSCARRSHDTTAMSCSARSSDRDRAGDAEVTIKFQAIELPQRTCFHTESTSAPLSALTAFDIELAVREALQSSVAIAKQLQPRDAFIRNAALALPVSWSRFDDAFEQILATLRRNVAEHNDLTIYFDVSFDCETHVSPSHEPQSEPSRDSESSTPNPLHLALLSRMHSSAQDTARFFDWWRGREPDDRHVLRARRVCLKRAVPLDLVGILMLTRREWEELGLVFGQLQRTKRAVGEYLGCLAGADVGLAGITGGIRRL